MKKQSGSTTRRVFVKTCLTAAAAVAANPARLVSAEPLKRYNRVLIVDPDGRPLSSGTLRENPAYIFHYPYVTTPSFLLDVGRSLDGGRELSTEDGQRYLWQGGSGPASSVVSFTAICAHKLSYPTQTVSFLNYRPNLTRYMDTDQNVREQEKIIYCCSERSVYDPSHGAEVIGGPARQPLTSVELEHDSVNDHYYAVGTRGGELYEKFFSRFGFRLAMEHELDNVRTMTEGTAVAIPHQQYSSQPVSC